MIFPTSVFPDWREDAFKEHVNAILRLHSFRSPNVALAPGIFDLLHIGHVSMLQDAKKQLLENYSAPGILIVAVNSDDSARQIKRKPVICFEHRLQMLAALSCVDLVVGFHEETPVDLCRSLSPDLMVKGEEYLRSLSLPGLPQCGGLIRGRDSTRVHTQDILRAVAVRLQEGDVS